jgi:hypothetical protein
MLKYIFKSHVKDVLLSILTEKISFKDFLHTFNREKKPH